MTGIVHRGSSGLRRPLSRFEKLRAEVEETRRRRSQATEKVDIRPLFDQLEREYMAQFDRMRAPQWYRPPAVDNTRPTPPAVTCETPAGVVDYPSDEAIDHYARGGVIRVPGRFGFPDRLAVAGRWVR